MKKPTLTCKQRGFMSVLTSEHYQGTKVLTRLIGCEMTTWRALEKKNLVTIDVAPGKVTISVRKDA